jgi:tetratricopeptide (TPR) repeat protein
MSLGSVEYQRRRPSRGRELFLSIIEAPDQDDLPYVIDQAGQFLINRKRYRDGLEIYSKGAARFPRAAVLHQGIGCCAGHLGLHEEAIAASRRALQLEPENQEFLNDLGWSLCQAGRLEEGLGFLGRAVAAKPDDRLAAENLRYWERRRTRGGRRPGPTSRGGGPAR